MMSTEEKVRLIIASAPRYDGAEKKMTSHDIRAANIREMALASSRPLAMSKDRVDSVAHTDRPRFDSSRRYTSDDIRELNRREMADGWKQPLRNGK